MSEAILDYKVDRSGWPSGPWDSEPDRVDFVCAELACFVLRHPRHGCWCAYVGVPKEHPCYGKEPFAVPAEIHMGLNYGGVCNGLICHIPEPGMPADVWWLGADFGHAFDLCPGVDAREFAMGVLPVRCGIETYRTLTYVRKQTEQLAKQLAAMR